MATLRGAAAGCNHKPNKREKEAIKWPWKIYRSRAEEEEERGRELAIMCVRRSNLRRKRLESHA